MFKNRKYEKKTEKDKDNKKNNIGQGKETKNKLLNIFTWNTNNLTEVKYQDVVKILEDREAIVCLQETHHTGKILNLNDGIEGLCRTRGGKGKKGGEYKYYLINQKIYI